MCRKLYHTSILELTNYGPSQLKEDINNLIDDINIWFRCNSLSLNFDKIYLLQFRNKNSYETDIKISCDNKLITKTKNAKFLGLIQRAVSPE